MQERLTQLLGVTALAAIDRLREATAAHGEPELGTLVHLQAWPGTSLNDLAAVIGRSQPATVRVVDRLVADGLVQRRPGRDRRTLALAVTAAGARAVEAALTARAAALTPLLEGLGDRDRAALERVLGRITAGLAEDRPGAERACRMCDRSACQTGPGCPLDHTVTP